VEACLFLFGDELSVMTPASTEKVDFSQKKQQKAARSQSTTESPTTKPTGKITRKK
jgi:hypothetical protein